MLTLTPCTVKEANRVVGRWHRHRKPTQGGLWAVAVANESGVCGVAIVGRPNAQKAQDGWTCEILRVATDGTYNACSKLYGACCRAASALGYRKVLTKTLLDESGASLRAAGFVEIGQTANQTWDRPGRRRVTVDLFGEPTTPEGPKRRWVRYLTKHHSPSPCDGAADVGTLPPAAK